MFSENSKLYIRVRDARAGGKKFSPEFVIHCEMIFDVESTHRKEELARKKYRRLIDVPPAFFRTPYLLDTNEIFKRFNSAAMDRNWRATFIDVNAVADINGIQVEAYVRTVSD